MLQTHLHWEDVQANLHSLGELLLRLEKPVDLILLPEMFTSGFTMHPERVSGASDKVVEEWLADYSLRCKACICGSIAAKEGSGYYNRMLWAEEGVCKRIYDKRHLFRMAGEHEVYQPGKESGAFVWKGWRILPRICYDLRFPVWNRSKEADLHIYLANWPQARSSAWSKLLMARAIENLCYVIGVNRVGHDGNEVAYEGLSAAIDYKGEPMHVLSKEDTVIYCELHLDELKVFREKFPAHLDADNFEIRP